MSDISNAVFQLRTHVTETREKLFPYVLYWYWCYHSKIN